LRKVRILQLLWEGAALPGSSQKPPTLRTMLGRQILRQKMSTGAMEGSQIGLHEGWLRRVDSSWEKPPADRRKGVSCDNGVITDTPLLESPLIV
jgi:hypothetical protein